MKSYSLMAEPDAVVQKTKEEKKKKRGGGGACSGLDQNQERIVGLGVFF